MEWPHPRRSWARPPKFSSFWNLRLKAWRSDSRLRPGEGKGSRSSARTRKSTGKKTFKPLAVFHWVIKWMLNLIFFMKRIAKLHNDIIIEIQYNRPLLGFFIRFNLQHKMLTSHSLHILKVAELNYLFSIFLRHQNIKNCYLKKDYHNQSCKPFKISSTDCFLID
jgi:hypothetical protein